MRGRLSVQPLEFVWSHEPPFIRHPDLRVVEMLFNWLGEQGVTKRSIPIPDRESGQWILFIYQPVDPVVIEAWRPDDSEE